MKTIPVSFLLSGMLLPAVCLAQPQPPPQGPPGDRMRHGDQAPHPFMDAWKKADADGDGFISLAEFNALPRVLNLPEEARGNIFERLDKDGDSKLSRMELMPFTRPPDGQPMMRLWELDTDKSGGVSLDEFKEGQIMKKFPPDKLAELFKRLDTDGDGLITPKDKPASGMHRGDERGRPNNPNNPEGRPFEHGGDPRRGGSLIQRSDTDGDGALTFEEFRRGPEVKELGEDEQEDRFQKLDRNGDSKITKEDLQPPPMPAPADR